MTSGTKSDPWALTTAPGTSAYTMYRDPDHEPPALVCQVGSTTLRYRIEAIEDLHGWLTERGDWVLLGAADEKKPAAPDTVEAWGRSPDNPVAVGTGSGTDTAAASACICHRYSKSSALQSSPTMRGTTACARCSGVIEKVCRWVGIAFVG
ncbi:DUF6855 family protein [Rhodococcus sp. Leaf233]|uniref:DUF6855 family protein n=1 Tax=Rhodococcus sp. Leaf233 TaxID=1736302 RepID=UPI000AAAFFBB|nr:hypothetical protein [Rhodococcus sp. Leaf233]